jgi:DNA processing protein
VSLADTHLDLLATCRVTGISWELVAREALRRGSVSPLLHGEILERSKAADAARSLLEASTPSLDERREWVQTEHSAAVEAGAKLLTVLDDDYPENLRLIVNLPPFIYVLGSLTSADTRSVAVVGTRAASPEGREKAARMARLLVDRDVSVVSGMAAGIDTAAHTAALDAGGRTMAVMGSGILGRYPKANAPLADRIASSGALVSQFWPSTPPRSYNFPMRNVVTSGISQGTVVIEASKTSGAKMQARLAMEHGKMVFLVESLVMQEKWAQRSARVVVVRTVDDVLTHLRSVEQVHELTSQRRQLVFDLAS